LAFSIAEQNCLLGLLDSERFADTAPAAVYATLLDEGHYHGSVRTMYRLLAAEGEVGEVGERRRQRCHPVYTKPELLAERPNEVARGMRDSAARRVGTVVFVRAGAAHSRADRETPAKAVAAHGQRRTWRAVLQRARTQQTISSGLPVNSANLACSMKKTIAGQSSRR
jgi:hypothetical protein